METYIIIISATITAIAYLLVNNIKTSNEAKLFPMALKDGNYVLSFPFNSTGNGGINPIIATKVYLKIKDISSVDVDVFAKISNAIDWQNIIDNIINDTPLEQPNYSSIDGVVLHNCVIVDCVIELDTPINAYIEIGTDLIIKITKQ